MIPCRLKCIEQSRRFGAEVFDGIGQVELRRREVYDAGNLMAPADVEEGGAVGEIQRLDDNVAAVFLPISFAMGFSFRSGIELGVLFASARPTAHTALRRGERWLDLVCALEVGDDDLLHLLHRL